MICRGCSNTRALIKIEVRTKGASKEVKNTINLLKTAQTSEEVQVYPFSVKNKPVDPKQQPQDVKFLLFAVDAPLSDITQSYQFISDFILPVTHTGGKVEVSNPVVEKVAVTKSTGQDQHQVNYEATESIYKYTSNRPSHKEITHLVVISKAENTIIPSKVSKVIVDSTETENVWGIKKAGKN